jgi:hypothetical protein
VLGTHDFDEGFDMWIETRHGPSLHGVLGRTRAALLTAVAMFSAGIAAASVSDWFDGHSGAATVALAGAALAAVAGAQAYWARAGSPHPNARAA